MLALSHHRGHVGLDDESLLSLADEPFRSRLLRLARDHGVLGLVLSTLHGPALRRRLPAEAAQLLRELFLSLRLRAAAWVLERDHVLTVLRTAGLDPVLLKGGALCTLLYAEPAEREFGDLDILLSASQIDDAARALCEAGYRNPWNEAQLRGYREHHYHLRLLHPHGFVVELHWALTKPGAPFRLSAQDFLEHAVRDSGTGGASRRVPRPEHLALHVVSQNTQDRFPRLARLVDLDRIVRACPTLDWNRLEQTAERGGFRYALGLTLELAAQLLETPVPREVVRSLRPGPLVRFHLGLLQPLPSFLEQRYVKIPSAGSLLILWLMPDARVRLRHLYTLVAGAGDPLNWIWRGLDRPSQPRRGSGFRPFWKVVAYQCGLYARGTANCLISAGRRPMRPWRKDVSTKA